MKFNRRQSAAFVAAALVLRHTGSEAQPARRPADVPVESFFAKPLVERVVLSPSGSHVAMTVRTAAGRYQLAVVDLATMKSQVVGALENLDVWRFQWVNDRRIVFQNEQPPAATPQPRIEFAALKASSAGDALSSAADLEALAVALIGDRLLTAATKAAVFPLHQPPRRLGQAGGAPGSNTGFWVHPDPGSWLVVLSNQDPPAGELMGQALGAVLAGQPCKPMAPRPMPPRAQASPGTERG